MNRFLKFLSFFCLFYNRREFMFWFIINSRNLFFGDQIYIYNSICVIFGFCRNFLSWFEPLKVKTMVNKNQNHRWKLKNCNLYLIWNEDLKNNNIIMWKLLKGFSNMKIIGKRTFAGNLTLPQLALHFIFSWETWSEQFIYF